jgi:predicted transposase/invertase (TIGR01784 family)
LTVTNSGHDYREIPNVIAVNIVDFDFPSEGDTHTCFQLREANNPSLILSPVLEIHFVNMVKWRKQREKGLEDPLNRWLAWFDEESPPELIAEVANMDSAVMAAYMQQDFITQNEEAWQEYWMHRKVEHDRISNLNGARREGEEIGLAKGLAKGRTEGLAEGKLEIARNALAKGATPEFVQDITGLSADAIRNIQALAVSS